MHPNPLPDDPCTVEGPQEPAHPPKFAADLEASADVAEADAEASVDVWSPVPRKLKIGWEGLLLIALSHRTRRNAPPLREAYIVRRRRGDRGLMSEHAFNRGLNQLQDAGLLVRQQRFLPNGRFSPARDKWHVPEGEFVRIPRRIIEDASLDARTRALFIRMVQSGQVKRSDVKTMFDVCKDTAQKIVRPLVKRGLLLQPKPPHYCYVFAGTNHLPKLRGTVEPSALTALNDNLSAETARRGARHVPKRRVAAGPSAENPPDGNTRRIGRLDSPREKESSSATESIETLQLDDDATSLVSEAAPPPAPDPGPEREPIPPDLKPAVEAYNAAVAGFGEPCKRLQPDSADRLRKRIDALGGQDAWIEHVGRIKLDDFLAGRARPKPGGRPFRISISVLINGKLGDSDIYQRLRAIPEPSPRKSKFSAFAKQQRGRQ